MAGGIKVALLTTATGLAIAIPVNIAYNYFVNRIDGLIMDMEQGTQQILNLAWDMEKEGKLTVVRKESVKSDVPVRRRVRVLRSARGEGQAFHRRRGGRVAVSGRDALRGGNFDSPGTLYMTLEG